MRRRVNPKSTPSTYWAVELLRDKTATSIKYKHMQGIYVRCAIFCTNHQHNTQDQKTNPDMNAQKYTGMNNYMAAREASSVMTKNFSDKITVKITIIKSTVTVIGLCSRLGSRSHLCNHFDINWIHMLLVTSFLKFSVTLGWWEPDG